MIQTPIYTPKGRAREYGDLACNIYTGCNHCCAYCFAPNVLHKDRELFHSHVEPRGEIVESVAAQLEREGITGKLIHLCFSCDPYPADIDTAPTREIIKLIKAAGNNVQILTKGGFRAERDFDLLDRGDLFGVTISGDFWNDRKTEVNAAPWFQSLEVMAKAHESGIKTWVSCEPVLYAENIYRLISGDWPIDHLKIGKLNYHKPEDFGAPPIHWGDFGREAERLCIEHGRSYYIKEGLRQEMNKTGGSHNG